MSILILAVVLFSFDKKTDTGIKISIANLRNNKGHVLISLFRDGNGYPDAAEKAIRKGRVVVKENKAWILFTGLPAGNYGVAILHDENDDQKMNTSSLGIPKEGYGFSNNVMGAFGPPSYKKASFNFSNNAVLNVSIKAKYF